MRVQDKPQVGYIEDLFRDRSIIRAGTDLYIAAHAFLQGQFEQAHGGALF